VFQQQQHQKLPYTIIAQQLSTTHTPTTLLIDSTSLPCSHQKITITMASLASDDNSSDDANYALINALTESRKKINLAPKHNIVPSYLEPPVWNVEKQVRIMPRTGKEVSKRMNDVSAQREHVNQMVQEARNIASNISMLKDTVPTIYYSSPKATHKRHDSYHQSLPPCPSSNYPQQTSTTPTKKLETETNTKSIQLLQDHIKDIHLTYKIEITRHKEEIKQLKTKLDNINDREKSRVDIENDRFQQEHHIAQLRNQWVAAEEIARSDFRNKLINEYREKEKLLQNRMAGNLTVLKTQFEQAALEQAKIDFKTSEIKQHNAVRNALQNERYKIRKYFRNLMNELTEELKDLYVVNKKQQASLTIINEWKLDMLEKLNAFSKTFNQLRTDIDVLKRRHPQNLMLLEKKYSKELNNLSKDLQSKIEEYGSVRKEKDHEYFLKKRHEKRLREGKINENLHKEGRRSPLSPTAFGCD
jgi:hypothetical protein